MGRGKLTDEVQARANDLLGRDINTDELRLFPYVMTRAMDYHELDMNHMNSADRIVWIKWRQEGLVAGGVSKGSLVVSERWWNIATELAKIGYVAAQGNLSSEILQSA